MDVELFSARRSLRAIRWAARNTPWLGCVEVDTLVHTVIHLSRGPQMPSHRCLVVLATTLLACQGRVPGPDVVADSTAIRALIDRTTVANNAGDIDGWVGLFEEGAVYMPPGSPEVTTAGGLREAAAAGFTRFHADIRITPVELVVLGDWAFSRSQVTGSVTPKAGGDHILIDIKQLVLYHRQRDGSWRIARLINNSNDE